MFVDKQWDLNRIDFNFKNRLWLITIFTCAQLKGTSIFFLAVIFMNKIIAFIYKTNNFCQLKNHLDSFQLKILMNWSPFKNRNKTNKAFIVSW